jgi:hypothetical protein
MGTVAQWDGGWTGWPAEFVGPFAGPIGRRTGAAG